MTVDLTTLDAHEQPSDQLRAKWKSYSRTEKPELLSSGDIDDLQVPEKAAEFCTAGTIPADKIRKAFSQLDEDVASSLQVEQDATIYYHPLIPGLLIVPSLLPPPIQKTLLSRLIHRDLSNPQHQTNLHIHYNLPYPSDEITNDNTTNDKPTKAAPTSFFTLPPTSPVLFVPKSPQIHKPLTIKQVLDRRLSWLTLGGQYDWTNRVYPGSAPPTFPPDIAGLLETLFPATQAQAAIVNFYTPGDTMMMHRDVSEEANKGLVSVSMGSDALFMIAPDGGGVELAAAQGKEGAEGKRRKEYLLLRIRSGDAIYMTQESRYAWHGVPKVLKGTCPGYLEDWPAEEDDQYEEWKGWMKNKRINLNVRQMRD